MLGSWRRFYKRWGELALDLIDRRWLELVPPLERLVPPAAIVDKRVYSPFAEPTLLQLLRDWRADALVITGAETDLCVLAAVLDAVDCGYRVVLARDAVCSSSDETHDALMSLYGNRSRSKPSTAGNPRRVAALIPATAGPQV